MSSPRDNTENRSVNFGFLEASEPALAEYVIRAEQHVFDDPNTGLVKLRQFGELLANHLASTLGLDTHGREYAGVMRALRRQRAIDWRIRRCFEELWAKGNEAVHHGGGDPHESLEALVTAHELACWYHRAFHDPRFVPEPFRAPPDPENAEATLRDELEELRARAAENLCYVIVTHNIYPRKEAKPQTRTGAFVAGPEKMVAVRETPGLLVADLDMDRLDYLRSRNYDEENLSAPEGDVAPLGCRPGQIWERDPELYAELAQPHKYSLDYRYFEEDLDKWIEEYKTIYKGKYADIQKKYGKLNFR